MNAVYTKTLYKNAGADTAWWRVQVNAADDGSASLLITHARSATAKAVSKAQAVKGKNIGRANETSPADQAVAEAKSRVAKQLDKGYVENESDARQPVTNTLGKRKPQLAVDIDKVKDEDIDWDTAFLQPKLDGNRAMRDDILYSRPGKEFVNLKHLSDAIAGTPLAALHLDGEIYIHGVSLQKIGSYIKKVQPETQALEYWLYDVMSDASFEERYKALSYAYSASGDLDIRIRLVPTFRVRSMAEAKAIHEKNLAEGWEGSILRWGKVGYEDDVRTKHLVKWKPFQDSEFEVIAHKPAKSSFKDGVEYKAAVFQYKLPDSKVTGWVLGPGDMYEKDQDARNADGMVGKFMTIEHMGFTPKGVPNIATAKCWRDDL